MVIDQFWLGMVIAVILSAALLFLIVMLQNTRHQQDLLREEKKVLEARIRNLESKIEFISSGSMGLGQRLMSAEKKLNQALEKQDELISNNSDHLFRRQADRILKDHLPEEDESSPSRSEAKLMALVGGKPKDKN